MTELVNPLRIGSLIVSLLVPGTILRGALGKRFPTLTGIEGESDAEDPIRSGVRARFAFARHARRLRSSVLACHWPRGPRAAAGSVPRGMLNPECLVTYSCGVSCQRDRLRVPGDAGRDAGRDHLRRADGDRRGACPRGRARLPQRAFGRPGIVREVPRPSHIRLRAERQPVTGVHHPSRPIPAGPSSPGFARDRCRPGAGDLLVPVDIFMAPWPCPSRPVP